MIQTVTFYLWVSVTMSHTRNLIYDSFFHQTKFDLDYCLNIDLQAGIMAIGQGLGAIAPCFVLS